MRSSNSVGCAKYALVALYIAANEQAAGATLNRVWVGSRRLSGWSWAQLMRIAAPVRANPAMSRLSSMVLRAADPGGGVVGMDEGETAEFGKKRA